MTTTDNTPVSVSSPSSTAAPGSTNRFTRRPSTRGVQLEDVLTAADEIVAKGQKPTIERVRQHLGSGSPNTVSPMLDVWFERLPQRLAGLAAPQARPQLDGPPLAVLQAAERFWDVARREAEQVQVQKGEADRREIELQRDALAHQQAQLQQREATFEQARTHLDKALAAAEQRLAAKEAELLAQQQESARILSETGAEVRRLRKAQEEALASKEALREKSEMALGAAQRDAKDAEQRHDARAGRLLADIDRERVAARQAVADLKKEQSARSAEQDASRAALEAARQALQAEKAARTDAAASWSRQEQATQIELATLRERAGAAEQRAGDLASQLMHQQAQVEREMAQLRESHAATAAALRQLEARQEVDTGKKSSGRPPRGKKPSD